MLRQIKTKVLPILLVVVMLFCSMGAAIADRETIGRRYTVTENGTTYSIQGAYSKNKTRIIIQTAQSQDYTEININEQKGTFTSTFYDYKGRGFLGTPRYSETHRSIDVSGAEDTNVDSVLLQAVSYNSLSYETLYYRYGYAYGSLGLSTYLKIKCTATYQIRTNDLTADQKTNCNAYTSGIKSIRSSMLLCKACSAGANVGVTVVIGVVALCVAFPPAIALAALAAAIGGAFVGAALASAKGAIDAALNAFRLYEDVKDIYVTIRTYGYKI